MNPVTLRKEIEQLEQNGVDVHKNLIISERLTLILPSHKLLDKASELAKGDKKIGSTLRGIGPTYMDKTGRNGLRVGDAVGSQFQQKYRALTHKHKAILDTLYQMPYELDSLEEEFLDAINFLQGLQIKNTESYLYQQIRSGKKILAEGAQGTLLDIEFGSYPFVTSSNTTASGACMGLGIPPSSVNKVYGISKPIAHASEVAPFQLNSQEQLESN